jgi:hypothetical protein
VSFPDYRVMIWPCICYLSYLLLFIMADCKSDIIKLWKSIFGDSDAYIDMFMERYFNKDLFLTYYIDNILVSQLCCVEYDFQLSDIYSADESCDCKCKSSDILFRGGYLCGLATLPDFRKKGFMETLIRECNMRLCNRNNIVSFLIPASDYLRLYYKKFGYVDISYINIDRYVGIHNFCDMNITEDSAFEYVYDVCLKDDYYKIINVNKYICNRNIFRDTELIDTIYKYYIDAINKISGSVIYHSKSDFITVINENRISDGVILVLNDKDDKLSGLLFCSNIKEEEATVQLLLSDSEEHDNILLQTLKNMLPLNTSLIVHRYDTGRKSTSDVSVTSSDVYVKYRETLLDDTMSTDEVSFSSSRKDSVPFAMAKILDVAEILKFVARSDKDAEFSILITLDDYEDNRGLFSVNKGDCHYTPLSEMTDAQLIAIERKCDSDLRWFHLTTLELSYILWRNPNDILVEEALVIPAFPISVFLMLE